MKIPPLKKIFDKDTGRKNYYLFYSMSFLFISIAVFSWYLFSGKTLIWYEDGWDQHYKSLIYYGKYLRQIVCGLMEEGRLIIPAWDPFIGEGSDILSTLHYYVIGDPFCITALLTPAKYMHYLYSFLIVLRLYLAGISFSYMCFELRQENRYAILSGSISYCFCYWAILNGARHPYFLNPMIWFPLIIVGVEKILHGKRPYLLTAAVLLSAVSNFYFFYIIVIETVVYVAVRLLLKFGKDIASYPRPVVKISLASLCGTMLAGPVLLPVLRTFLTDSRMDISRPWHLLYPLRYYSKLPSLLTNTTGEDYYWVCLGYAVPVLLSMGLLFIKKEKSSEDKLYKVFLAISLLVLLVPALGQFINGMSYMSNRWCWGLALLCSFLLTVQWDQLVRLGKADAIKLFWLLCCYTGLCMLLDKSRNIVSFYSICLALILLLLLVYIVKNVRYRQYVLTAMVMVSVISNSFWKSAYSDKTYHYSAETMDLKEIYEACQTNETEAVKAISGKEYTQGNYIRYSGRELTFNANIWKKLSSSNYFWSISNPYVTTFRNDLEMTESIPQKYKDYDDRADLLGLSSIEYFTVKDQDSLPVPYGFSLLGSVNVREKRTQAYIQALEKRLGKTLTKSQKNMISRHSDEIYRVYKNNNVLPLGYVYDQYIEPEKWQKMTAMEKQEAMLTAVCLSEPADYCEAASVLPKETAIDYETDSDHKYIIVNDHKIVTTADNQQITLNFKGDKNSETYLELKGLNFTPTSKYDLYFGIQDADPLNIYNEITWDMLGATEKKQIRTQHLFWIRPNVIDISFTWPLKQPFIGTGTKINGLSQELTPGQSENLGQPLDSQEDSGQAEGQEDKFLGQTPDNGFVSQLEKTISYNTPDYNFYGGRHDFMVNLGYNQEALTSVTLTFPHMGIYNFDSLKILCRSMDHFEEKIAKLKDHSLENISLDTDSLQGDVRLEEPGILCVSIPYSEGWQAFVDGIELPVMVANERYLGLELDEGTHHILFKYSRPCQKAGFYVCMAGLLVFLVTLAGEERKRKKKI